MKLPWLQDLRQKTAVVLPEREGMDSGSCGVSECVCVCVFVCSGGGGGARGRCVHLLEVWAAGIENRLQQYILLVCPSL